MKTISLLILSNLFMTIAWYGHLKHKDATIWKVILISWFIAFFEYCLQVPANRIGFYYENFSAFQLKITQEIISILVFCLFAIFYLKEGLKWNYLVGFFFILLSTFFVFKK